MTSYSIDFSSGDPVAYNTNGIPLPGNFTGLPAAGVANAPIDGSALIDGTSQGSKVESLAPDDLALGQITPFLFEISATSGTQNSDGGLTVTAGWSTKTTGNDDFGYDESFGVYTAFIDYSDPANANLSGNEQLVFSWAYDALTDQIVGTFTVTGLEAGETLVVESWLVLDSVFPPGSSVTVQSALLTAVDLDGAGISSGNQTVPLLRVKDFEDADADLQITKTDLTDPVHPGDLLTYEITVTNNGPAVANLVTVTDDLDPYTTYVSDTGGGDPRRQRHPGRPERRHRHLGPRRAECRPIGYLPGHRAGQ